MLEWFRSLFPCRECARLRDECIEWSDDFRAVVHRAERAERRADEAEARALELSRLVHMIAVCKGPDVRLGGEA